MSAGKAFYTILKDDAAVSAIVTSGGQTRIYPQLAPQNKSKPYMVYNQVTMNLPRHLGSSSDTNYIRMQLDIYADKYSTLRDLSDKCRLALDNYRGLVTLSVGTAWVEYLAQGS